MRFNYKVLPLAQPHPAFPHETSIWVPVLPIKVDNPATHAPPTKRFEAIIDSGAPDCYFHSDIGRAIGFKVEHGIQGSLSGVVHGALITVYYHDIGLYVGADRVRIRAGFSDQVSVAAILGRRGFFDNFIVTFDPTLVPPGFDIQRVARS